MKEKISYFSFFEQGLAGSSFTYDWLLTNNVGERYLVYASVGGFVTDAVGQWATKVSLLINGGTVLSPIPLTSIPRTVIPPTTPFDGSINVMSDWIWTGAVPVQTPSLSLQITVFPFPGITVDQQGYWATIGFLTEREG